MTRPEAAERDEPRRILHVVPSLVHAGIEVWLMNLMRATDRRRWPMDFLVLSDQPGECEDDVRALGSRVYPVPDPRRPWKVAGHLKHVLQTAGPFSVVHSHVHHYSGLIMRVAAGQRVPVRVVHSHNDTRGVEAGASWRRRLYLALMRRWIARHATHRVAVSRSAAEDLFGPGWQTCSRIIPCGLELSAFAAPDERREVRRAWGLAEDALVLGHVGRFHWRKNHHFLLEVAAEVCAREPATRLLLVGEGELRQAIAARAEELKIADRVVFTGASTDVARLMQAMDVFVFPSYHEGLGLVVLEAQASGLPCVLASDLPDEVNVVPGLLHRVPRSAPASMWAMTVLQAARAPSRPGAGEAWQMVSRSPFSIQRSAVQLLAVYDGGRADGTDLAPAGEPLPAAAGRERGADRQLVRS